MSRYEQGASEVTRGRHIRVAHPSVLYRRGVKLMSCTPPGPGTARSLVSRLYPQLKNKTQCHQFSQILVTTQKTLMEACSERLCPASE